MQRDGLTVNFGRFLVIGFSVEKQSGSINLECPPREQPVKCGICGAVVQRRCYKRHLDKHTSLKTHVCHLCGKLYTRKDSLQRHVMSVHKLYDTGDPDPQLIQLLGVLYLTLPFYFYISQRSVPLFKRLKGNHIWTLIM